MPEPRGYARHEHCAEVSEILGEALERYLGERGSRRATTSVVADAWGVLKLDRRNIDRLLGDEGCLFDVERVAAATRIF